MKEQKEYFKVLGIVDHEITYDDGTITNLISCYSYTPLYYAKGKTTRRENGFGPMAVFDTLDNAEKFVEDLRRKQEIKGFAIYKCTIKRNNRAKTLWYSKHIDRRFWFGWQPQRMNPYDLPDGTVLADEVTLTERVCYVRYLG